LPVGPDIPGGDYAPFLRSQVVLLFDTMLAFLIRLAAGATGAFGPRCRTHGARRLHGPLRLCGCSTTSIGSAPGFTQESGSRQAALPVSSPDESLTVLRASTMKASGSTAQHASPVDTRMFDGSSRRHSPFEHRRPTARRHFGRHSPATLLSRELARPWQRHQNSFDSSL
jgi:hypothetical protein